MFMTTVPSTASLWNERLRMASSPMANSAPISHGSLTVCLIHYTSFFIYHRQKELQQTQTNFLLFSPPVSFCILYSFEPPHHHTVPSLSAAEICFVLTSPPTPPLQLITTFVPKLILCVHMTQIRSPRQITKHTFRKNHLVCFRHKLECDSVDSTRNIFISG